MKPPLYSPLASLILLLCGFMSTTSHAASSPKGSALPPLLAHYMAWYEAKPVSGGWGWHWTMNHFAPDAAGPGGRRPIASHIYPLIGPYDSSDPDVLEYHALLMKLAGIDGVLVDWYGDTDFLDYALVHRNTRRLIDALKRFGLKFAICYEDQSVKHMVEVNSISSDGAMERGPEHLRWLDEQWFKEPGYVKWRGKPLLLVYGPQYFTSEQWTALISGLKTPPSLFFLDHPQAPAVGAFAWPPMWMSKGGTLTQGQVGEYLKSFHAQPNPTIAVAFPGFHDVYAEAGVHPSFGFLDSGNGQTFSSTLRQAVDSVSPFVQIATWNDFGEGTGIEPARDHGYRYLEQLQGLRKGRGKTFPYKAADLRLPLRIYHLRKRLKTTQQRKGLDEIVRTLLTGRTGTATRRLDQLARTAEGAAKADTTNLPGY